MLLGASLSAETFLLAVGEGQVEAAALVMADYAPRTLEEGYVRNRDFMSARARLRFAGGGGRRDQQPHGPRAAAQPGRSGKGGAQAKRRPLLLALDQRLIDWRVREYATRHERMAAAARNVRIPTLLVRGGKSDILSEEGAQEFLQLVPHAKYVTLPNAGHMLAADKNDGFGRAAVEFLGSLGRG